MSSREQEIREGAAANLMRDMGKSKIAKHQMPWDKYAQKSRIDADQCQLLQQFATAHSSVRGETLKQPQKANMICKGLVDIVTLSRGDCPLIDQMYVLTLIDNMINEDPSRVELFRNMNVRDKPIFQAFLSMIPDAEEPALRLITHIQAMLHYPGLGYGKPMVNKWLSNLTEFLIQSLDGDKLKSDPKKKVDEMIDMTSCFMVFLREQECRTFVTQKYPVHRHLSAFLPAALQVGNVQLLYQVGFCLWLLAYDPAIAEEMATTDVVVNMLKVMKSVSKEKVIRVCLACLKNLVDKADHNQTMIDNNAIKQIAILQNRKWSDDEVKEDLDIISESLGKSIHVLSSIEMYRKEIHNGRMEWTPVHKSETFWRDNVTKICPVGASIGDAGAEDLMTLVRLLNAKIDKTSTGGHLNTEEQTTVAVICHDLGEFSRFHPQGKRILQASNGVGNSDQTTKNLIMTLMTTPPGGSEEIGKQALTCIHKMMVTNWQFLEARS